MVFAKTTMSNVRISPVSRSDSNELIFLCNGNKHQRPWLTPFANQDNFDDWIGLHQIGPYISFVVRNRPTDDIIGIVTLGRIANKPFHSAEIGYFRLKESEHRGLMTEAVQKATSYAFSELNIHRLEAHIHTNNASSIALAQRVGFNFEGIARDYIRVGSHWNDLEQWALLAPENADQE